MNETTKRVAISPSDDESEIVKVRILGTYQFYEKLFSKYYLHYYFLFM